MSSPKLANNAVGALASALTTSATSLTLGTGQGAKFPSLGAGEYFVVTIIRIIDRANEIVKITARSGDVLTMARAQEGTTALAFDLGDFVELRMTAGAVDSLLADKLNVSDVGVLVPSTTGYNKSNWDTAYSWGNHASAGYETIGSLIMRPNRIDESISIPDGHNAFFIDPVEFGPNVTVTGIGNSTLRGV